VPRRLVIAVLLAAVLLAASTLAGCSTATEPPVRPATSAAATASTELAPQLSTPATTASGPATNQGLPAAGAPGSRTARYVFPVRGCRASYGHGHPYYPATDIFTDRGCRFVAPTDGAVDEVSRVDRWDTSSDRGADRGGLSVSVIGMDGVRYYGSHLQSIAPGIVPGARVRAGQLLGRIDNSGDARTTPTHVHFGCPGRPHRASGGSAAASCTPGPTWMPGARVATSLQLPRSRPPTTPPAATSHPCRIRC
jgi:peptidoglycan LD-endopeptidase LytH